MTATPSQPAHNPSSADTAPLHIAFQGEAGSNSHLAALELFPNGKIAPMATFEDAFIALTNRDCDVALTPVENSVIGRIADVLRLLPDYDVRICGEYFLRVEHHLMAGANASLSSLTHVHSQIPALSQCRNLIQQLGLDVVPTADTAGAARFVASSNNHHYSAIATRLAAQLNKLTILKSNIEDHESNITRFLILKHPDHAHRPPPSQQDVITTFLFRVRNVPAALYKALGGFASNGINMTKLESCPFEGSFEATRFFAEIIAHPDMPAARNAFDELKFFSSELTILGVYQQDPARHRFHHHLSDFAQAE